MKILRLNDLSTHLSTIVPRTLEAVVRPYPTGLAVQATGPGEWLEHTDRYPIFYGCYDWHSAVHSHWQLLRVLRLFPDHPATAEIRGTIDAQFRPESAAGEMASLASTPGFSMPYGMAWLLQLGEELYEWDDGDSRRWLSILQPLIEHAAEGFLRYLEAIALPVRTGTHNQSAFSLGLAHDWATTLERDDLLRAIDRAALSFYRNDKRAPLTYEPSGVDFLSPALAEADLMRRVLPSDQLTAWLEDFFPEPGLTDLLPPQKVLDPSNGQLAHIAGLNMSRAWMAEGIASALSPGHPIRERMTDLAERHRVEGFEAALHSDYMVSHWAPTYVIYLMTGRGLPRNM